MSFKSSSRKEADKWSQSSAGIALIYALVGILWIVLSDRIVADLFPTSIQLFANSTKGTLYVIATAALLFLLVRRSRRALTDRARAIEEREERLRTLVDAIAEEVWACDRDGKMSLLNVGHRPTHMGLPEFTGKTVFEVLEEVEILTREGKPRPPDEAPLLRSLNGEVARGEEIMRHRRTGVTRYRQFTSSPIHDTDGSITGAVAVVRDITESKEMEKALLKAKQEAEAASAAKDQFLAVLSHELRTPLTPVLAGMSLIKRHPQLPAELLHHVEIIRRNVCLEARLIDDLLDLTRIVKGKLSLNLATLDVGSILERAVETCRVDIEARKLHLTVTVPPAPVHVTGDASRLQQVFWNLLNNSAKFTQKGGNIEVRCRAEREYVVIDVIDDGIGIEPHVLPRIFDAFEQGEKKVTRQFGGLGLGLAITKRLVEMHRGSVMASSGGSGKGATFRVSVPLVAENKTEPEKEQAAEVSTPEKCAAKRILLVEDHGDTAQMMRDLLEGIGYIVETAGDVAEALSAAASRPFDLLISDLGLPDRSGLDLMRELRQSGRQIRGIALSGFGREEDVRRSKEAGFTEHITKPVDLDILEKTIERVAFAA